MFARTATLFRDERGNSIVEYALILSLVALIAVFGVRVLGTSVNTKLTDASSSITLPAATGTAADTGGNANNKNNGHGGNGYGYGNGGGRFGG